MFSDDELSAMHVPAEIVYVKQRTAVVEPGAWPQIMYAVG